MENRTIASRPPIQRETAARTIATPENVSRSLPTRGGVSTDRAGSLANRAIAAVNGQSTSTPTNEPYRPLYGSDNPFEILADAFTKAFGTSVYNPPLQSQSTGYGSVGGGSFLPVLILAGIGVAVYFYFKNK